ncbi:MAG TPA: hypothetical protein VFK54_09970 [Candidatus Limnocylindrales bacterium]|nr:hypothetical protein [Candidatus Limnocylindrales bacterium]
MPFVRTVHGDIDPAELGPTYAHEHLAIAGGRPRELFPDFVPGDVDEAVEELGEPMLLGLRAVVDGMPADAGRDVLVLAEIASRTGLHVIAPTGLHHERYYDDRHWSLRLVPDELAELFEADIEIGIDALDYGGPAVRRTPHRAGVIKVAGSEGGPSARDARIFAAAALAQRRTGCPILTHCEHGTGAIEQLGLLREHGADLGHVILSHTDKRVDRSYHQEILASGAFVEYDQSFRWPDGQPNGTLQLLEWIEEDGLGGQVMLGMDAARRGYWRVYGGRPGMSFLLGPFRDAMRARGISEASIQGYFVANPARAFAFGEVQA